MSSSTYCSACDTWSPTDQWIDGWTDAGDDSGAGEGYVECPTCGHHHPELDPPSREEAA